MDFDLRTTDSAYSFVLDALGITGEQFIDEYIVECDRDYERLWEKYYRQLVRWSIDKNSAYRHSPRFCPHPLIATVRRDGNVTFLFKNGTSVDIRA